MKKNVNDYERVFRFVGGVFLTSLAFWGPRDRRYLSFMIPIITGATGWCPLYAALGISTRKDEQVIENQQANDYFPVQSVSERAAGHPLVGAA